jgi:hypothetical protein
MPNISDVCSNGSGGILNWLKTTKNTENNALTETNYWNIRKLTISVRK